MCICEGADAFSHVFAEGSLTAFCFVIAVVIMLFAQSCYRVLDWFLENGHSFLHVTVIHTAILILSQS